MTDLVVVPQPGDPLARLSNHLKEPAVTPASPADERCALDPAAVGALAEQIHTMRCVPLSGPSTFTDKHREDDLSRARFLLLGLRESGWTVRRDAPAVPECCGESMLRNSRSGTYECASAFFELLDGGVLSENTPEQSDTDAMNDRQRERYKHWKTSRTPGGQP